MAILEVVPLRLGTIDVEVADLRFAHEFLLDQSPLSAAVPLDPQRRLA